MEKMKVDIGDAELAVEIEGSGKPVLLIAGLGGRLAFWRQQRPALAEQFRLVLHDHRGTGGSTRSQMDYSVEQMSNDVLRLMDTLDIERAHLVGHSTGGAIVQTIALHHPDRAEKIVLSATWPGQDPFFQALFDLRAEILERCGPRALPARRNACAPCRRPGCRAAAPRSQSWSKIAWPSFPARPSSWRGFVRSAPLTPGRTQAASGTRP